MQIKKVITTKIEKFNGFYVKILFQLDKRKKENKYHNNNGNIKIIIVLLKNI